MKPLFPPNPAERATRASKTERNQYRAMMWKNHKLVYCLTPHPHRPNAWFEEFKPERECHNVTFERLLIGGRVIETMSLPICKYEKI